MKLQIEMKTDVRDAVNSDWRGWDPEWRAPYLAQLFYWGLFEIHWLPNVGHFGSLQAVLRWDVTNTKMQFLPSVTSRWLIASDINQLGKWGKAIALLWRQTWEKYANIYSFMTQGNMTAKLFHLLRVKWKNGMELFLRLTS